MSAMAALHSGYWMIDECVLIECRFEKMHLLFDSEGQTHIYILDSCYKALL